MPTPVQDLVDFVVLNVAESIELIPPLLQQIHETTMDLDPIPCELHIFEQCWVAGRFRFMNLEQS
jgi:hypothetical protein